MPPLADSMSQDCRQHPFEGVDGWCDFFQKTLPTSPGEVSELSLLVDVPVRPKLNSDLALSDGPVVRGPGCALPRITATHPSGPDVKVLWVAPCAYCREAMLI